MPYNSGKFLWTGKSNGWQKVEICFGYFLIKPGRGLHDNFGYRFLFKSDSIANNSPGWVIDKINLQSPTISGSVKDMKYQALDIFPNPSSDGIYNIHFPSTYVKGRFYVYDKLGRLLLNTALKEKVDLSALPADMFYYKAHFEKTDQWFAGVLIKD